MKTALPAESVIFTHCGKLGDCVYTWPIAAWMYRTTGRKVHWVLPRSFGPFRFITSLLQEQEFTDRVSLVDYVVEHYGRGGQPYHFDPWKYLVAAGETAVTKEVFNLGFRAYPDKYIPQYQAEEYGLGWDDNWVLNLGGSGDASLAAGGPPEGGTPNLTDICTEHANFHRNWERIDTTRPILENARRMAWGGRRAHCWYSGMAVILYYARVPFTLHRVPGHPPVEHYFPDRSRYKIQEHAVAVRHPSFDEVKP